jgi:hypothetical protein
LVREKKVTVLLFFDHIGDPHLDDRVSLGASQGRTINFFSFILLEGNILQLRKESRYQTESLPDISILFGNVTLCTK